MSETYEEDKFPCHEIWEEFNFGSYNAAVDRDIINVMVDIKVNRPAYVTGIAQRLNLSQTHVELIQYIICSMDYAEYGTSPRGCWLTEKGEKMLETFLERLGQ